MAADAEFWLLIIAAMASFRKYYAVKLGNLLPNFFLSLADPPKERGVAHIWNSFGEPGVIQDLLLATAM